MVAPAGVSLGTRISASRFAEAVVNRALSWLFLQPLSEVCRPPALLQLTVAAVSARLLLKPRVPTRTGVGAGFVTSGCNFLQCEGPLLTARCRYLGPRFVPVPDLMLVEIITQERSFFPCRVTILVDPSHPPPLGEIQYLPIRGILKSEQFLLIRCFYERKELLRSNKNLIKILKSSVFLPKPHVDP